MIETILIKQTISQITLLLVDARIYKKHKALQNNTVDFATLELIFLSSQQIYKQVFIILFEMLECIKFIAAKHYVFNFNYCDKYNAGIKDYQNYYIPTYYKCVLKSLCMRTRGCSVNCGAQKKSAD